MKLFLPAAPSLDLSPPQCHAPWISFGWRHEATTIDAVKSDDQRHATIIDVGGESAEASAEEELQRVILWSTIAHAFEVLDPVDGDPKPEVSPGVSAKLGAQY